MSRFNKDGPEDQDELLALGRWLGRRKAVLNGRPGKAALRTLEQALLALPHKRLIEGSLCDATGVCATGAWVYRHYVDSGMTPKEAWRKLRRESRREGAGALYGCEALHKTVEITVRELGITKTLAEVVAFENDEAAGWTSRNDSQGQERRYDNMLAWVQKQLRSPFGAVN